MYTLYTCPLTSPNADQFSNSLTVRLCSKPIKSLKITLHSKCVTTLPCEIFWLLFWLAVANFWVFVPRCMQTLIGTHVLLSHHFPGCTYHSLNRHTVKALSWNRPSWSHKWFDLNQFRQILIHTDFPMPKGYRRYDVNSVFWTADVLSSI